MRYAKTRIEQILSDQRRALAFFETPYEAGRHAAINGASLRNCHFGWFGSAARTQEWQRGYDDAKASRSRETTDHE